MQMMRVNVPKTLSVYELHVALCPRAAVINGKHANDVCTHEHLKQTACKPLPLAHFMWIETGLHCHYVAFCGQFINSCASWISGVHL